MSDTVDLHPYLVRLDDGTEIPVDPDALAEEGTRLLRIRGNQYVLMRNGRTTPVILDPADRRHITVIHALHQAEAVVSDHRDQLLAELGADTGVAGKESEVHAPMPGLVLQVHVSPGDTVQQGDSLLVLEAMKMENDIKAHFGGVVRSVQVNTGDAVGKGALLIEFE